MTNPNVPLPQVPLPPSAPQPQQQYQQPQPAPAPQPQFQQPAPAPQFQQPAQPASAPAPLPQPAPQFQQPVNAVSPAPAHPLRTKRGLLKYILLGLITFGIYDIWQMSEVGDTLNLLASRRDGKRTMHYCLMFFLVGWITFGIGWFVWGHRISARVGDEQAARGMRPTVTAVTYWLWNVLGAFIIIGPWVYMYKLLHAMNDLCADYNQRGI